MVQQKKEENKELEKRQPTYGERFVAKVKQEFEGAVGEELAWDDYKRKLAVHLFSAVDNSLKELEAKRLTQKESKTGVPITWDNINMQKLALDAVHRIELGLDALIPNHIHTIPYFNKRVGKYNLDLRVGYRGKDLYRRKVATEEPVDITYELVYDTDEFTPLKKSKDNESESYKFEITEPFDRGNVVGGFGYIEYDDPRKNKLVIVPKSEFEKSRQKAQADNFWKDHTEKMQFKTLVHRVTDHLSMDPEKVNASYAQVEMDDAQTDLEQNFEDIGSETIDVVPEEKPQEEKKEAPKEEEKKGENGSPEQATIGGPDW